MVILADDLSALPPSASKNDIAASVAALQILGAKIYSIPPIETEGALDFVPPQNAPTPAFWLGYVPPFERYQAIYNASRERNLVLPNTPDEHLRAQEFDLSYICLEELTPRTLVAQTPNHAHEAALKIGFPVFVKGAVQSRKSRGWRACVAENEKELRELTAHLLELENRSRGRVLVRELVPLKHSRIVNGFPLGREFRVFVWRENVVALGYYWEGADPFQLLSQDEKNAVQPLALEAARRLRVPFLAVDIGQKTDERWIVIEVGDGNFAGLSQIKPLALWNRIFQVTS